LLARKPNEFGEGATVIPDGVEEAVDVGDGVEV
jgi:hypothetical protein